jgi:predicted phosphodiesterase
MKRSLLLLFLLALLGFTSGRIVIYGDTRTQDDQHRLVVEQIARHDPLIVFHTGDISQRGKTQAEYDDFSAITAAIQAPIFPARGNHERSESLFLENFPTQNGNTWYTVLHDSLLFVILDTTKPLGPESLQYAWLQETLAQAVNPVIIILHHPVISSGAHGDELGLALYLPNLLQKHRVKAVFSGHDHNYEHLHHKGIHYIVTGGGGAPLRGMKTLSPHSLKFLKTHHFCLLERDPDQLTITVYNEQGLEVDRFAFTLAE